MINPEIQELRLMAGGDGLRVEGQGLRVEGRVPMVTLALPSTFTLGNFARVRIRASVRVRYQR